MSIKANYDTPWKLVLERYFQQWLEFLLPIVAQEIDWQKPLEFLDKELLTIQTKVAVGNRIADKLVKVTKKGGEEAWVIIHVEVQGNEENDFSQRMFEYFYRIHDKYKKPLFSLAILTDTNKQWRPQRYFQKLWDCELLLKYPMIKLIDYIPQEENLGKDPNPIAKIILAHLIALRTRNKPVLRFENKLKLVKNLYQLGYNADYVRTLYNFIDFTMTLPNELEQAFFVNIKKHEEKMNMRYVTSIEKFLIKEANHSAQCEILRFQLESKFGKLKNQHLELLNAASPSELERIALAVVNAQQIEQVFSEEIA